jgi:hypothetical protein
MNKEWLLFLRVVTDPRKNIGFNIMSLFHLLRDVLGGMPGVVQASVCCVSRLQDEGGLERARYNGCRIRGR